jgi:hypothetical protein
VEQHQNVVSLQESVGLLQALDRLRFIAVGLLLKTDASLSFGVVLLCACVGLLFIADVLLFETDVKMLFHALLPQLHDVLVEQTVVLLQ